jgi:hypothetical protein
MIGTAAKRALLADDAESTFLCLETEKMVFVTPIEYRRHALLA